nr:hypothetical protein [Bacteroidota bacterium]
MEIDSIRLVTSAGSSIVASYIVLPGEGYPNFDSLSIITNSNLRNPISIDPQGDQVKLISYVWDDDPFDSVPFGNFPGSTLDCIQDGESISYITYVQSMGITGGFCMDISPTIGYGNDTTGALSTFSGQIFDPFGQVIT